MKAAEVLTGERRWSVEKSDCLPWLRSLPADCIDLIFTSPPYEEARTYLEGGINLNIARGTEEWVKWLIEVFTECRRVCTGLVAMVVEGQTKGFRYSCGPDLLRADLHRSGFCLRKSPIYQRNGIPGSGGPDWLRNDYEPIVCVTRPGKLPWSDNTACGHPPIYGPGGAMSNRNMEGRRCSAHSPEERQNYTPPSIANPGNIIDCGAVGGGNIGSRLASENEAPFPEKLAKFFIRSFCPPDGIACDPFSGSGTTCSVSIEEGRRFVGCDLRQSQVSLAIRRMSGVTPSMFPSGLAERAQ